MSFYLLFSPRTGMFPSAGSSDRQPRGREVWGRAQERRPPAPEGTVRAGWHRPAPGHLVGGHACSSGLRLPPCGSPNVAIRAAAAASESRWLGAGHSLPGRRRRSRSLGSHVAVQSCLWHWARPRCRAPCLWATAVWGLWWLDTRSLLSSALHTGTSSPGDAVVPAWAVGLIGITAH